MKTRSLISASVALLLAGGIVSTFAAEQPKKAEDQARKESCFRAHGYLMDKPALRNINDCWRVHSFKM